MMILKATGEQIFLDSSLDIIITALKQNSRNVHLDIGMTITYMLINEDDILENIENREVLLILSVV